MTLIRIQASENGSGKLPALQIRLDLTEFLCVIDASHKDVRCVINQFEV